MFPFPLWAGNKVKVSGRPEKAEEGLVKLKQIDKRIKMGCQIKR